ncbi:MAG: helix-turn-helix domain-containing protein [Dehalococcoidia bacterium]
MAFNLGPRVKAARVAARMTQQQLADAIGVTKFAVINWERDISDLGHRTPVREHLIALTRTLGVAPEEERDWLDGLGYPRVAPDRFPSLRQDRRSLREIQAEIDTYPWPCLAMNEEFEVVAWNDAANDLSELDMGVDLAGSGARHLLRMALSDRYNKKLTNWKDVIAILMAMYKNGGHDLYDFGTLTPYMRRLVADILQDHSDRYMELVKLWEAASPHPEGVHNVFEAKWRTSDGVDLRFHCAITAWSAFDGTGGFDWHPADAQTWRWLDARRADRLARNDRRGATLAEMNAGRLLRLIRERHGLTQAQLAQTVNRSESLIAEMERGAKRINDGTVAEIGRALEVDASTLNAVRDAAGVRVEPSQQSAYQLGYAIDPDGRRYTVNAAPLRHWTDAEIAAEIDGFPWPTAIVDGRCEVVATNERCRAAIGLDVRGRAPGPARNLVTIVTERWFREGVEDWSAVVGKIFPKDLEIYAAPPGVEPPEKDDGYFSEVIQHVREREVEAGRSRATLSDVREAWRANPSHRRGARVTFAMGWGGTARRLAFNVVIIPWNAMIDPYWAIELHPADADTWELLEVVRK